MATVGPRQGKPPFGLENPPERGGRTLGATKTRTAWPREQGYWHGGFLSGHQKSPGQPRGLRRATPTATATSPQLVHRETPPVAASSGDDAVRRPSGAVLHHVHRGVDRNGAPDRLLHAVTTMVVPEQR